MPTLKSITVNISFPEGDKHKRPVVTSSCTESDLIESSYDGIEWVINSNLTPPDADGLKLTGVTFYQGGAPAPNFLPPMFQNRGRNNGNFRWDMLFNGNAVDNDTSYTYQVDFQDDDFSSLSWDPTMTIQKRNASQPAGG